MNALIYVAEGPNAHHLAELTVPSFQKWADIWGYKVVRWHAYNRTGRGATLPASWQKLIAARAALEAGYERVLTIDVDAFIRQPEDPTWATALDGTDRDLAIAYGVDGPNCGVMLWQSRDDRFMNLLDYMLSQARNYLTPDTLWEQGALNRLLHVAPQHYESMLLLPRRFNACTDAKATWDRDDVIVHFPGQPYPDKLHALTVLHNQAH